MVWYKETTESLTKILRTSERGLSASEARDRLQQYGLNQLAVKKEPWWRVVVEPFRSVFVAVLGLAALVSFLSHEPLDAVIIAAIITVNAAIFYVQQYMTNRVLRSLKKHSIGTVAALRDGQKVKISSLEIVPGDMLILSEGERVPADARVFHSDNLQVNESSLTGESEAVRKHALTLESDHQIYEQDNMVFQGTYVTAGSARVLVVETGARTEFGKIAKLAAGDRMKSPVQAKIDQLITILVKAVGVLAVIVFLLSLARGTASSEALRFVLSLSVSAVPEGLPVALTVIIVLGMRRMAKQKALVRSFKAIEDVGLITTIATDKTGTLTKNHLTVVDSWNLGADNAVALGKKTMDSHSQSDPLDVAIAGDAKKLPDATKLYPFDLSLRMSGAYHQSDGLVYIKGSPEHVLNKSKLTEAERATAESKMHELAAKGYRVIAVASFAASSAPPNLSNVPALYFAGFIALADELRPEVSGAIQAARSAGMSVRLLTGDHFETAYNIGKTVGIATHPSEVIQGTDLPAGQMDLSNAIRNKTVFARILPEDKFRILQALKQTEIVAMTGDGVNDVPALANAHVGFAMGTGSDIAKDAGGIVLLNDNFATIVQAIREGRKIYDNIRRMLFYLLSTSLGEVLTMVGALLFGLPLPVTAIQILWINLVTDTAMVLPLGLEPEEEGAMKRPPRRPKEPLLNRILLSRMVLVASTMAVVTIIIVAVLHDRGHSIAYIQTVAFMALIAAQWMNTFNARSELRSSFSRLKVANRAYIVGLAVAMTLQALAMFGPLRPVFDIQPVPLLTLLFGSGAMALSVLTVVELQKAIIRFRAAR